MNWLNDVKLSTRLITSFAICALITLAVGGVGGRGVSDLASSLRLVFSNNLVSVAKTAETKVSAVAQNRDLYRLISATAGGAPQPARDEILSSMKANRAASEKAFSTYRTTPLADDERIAGDRMEKEWPAYQAQVDRAVALLGSGKVDEARLLISGDLQQAYMAIVNELTLMVESNNRQIGEGSDDATVQENSAKINLYIGIALAFLRHWPLACLSAVKSAGLSLKP